MDTLQKGTLQAQITLPITPYRLQQEIIDDKHRFRIVACGRRWGKTMMAIRAVVEMMAEVYSIQKRKARAWVISPTFPLVREDWIIAEEMLKDIIVNKKQTEMKLDLRWIGALEFKSAEREDEGLRGAGLDCAVVDEASRVSKKSWEQGVRPALADRLGRAIFISTPKGRNWFYDLWLKGQENSLDTKSWRYSTFDNPYFPKGEKEAIMETTPELILRQEYLADFLEDEATVFRNLDKCLRGELADNNDKEKYSIGVDLGKTEDFTVITVVRESDCQLVHILKVNKIDWSLQKKYIKAICNSYHNNIVYIDSTGVGDPIEEDLSKSDIVVRGYKFTNTSKQVLIEQLIVAIEQQMISIPNVDETRFLIDELKAFTYEMLPSGKIRYTAPEGLHDDGVISLGLAIKGMSYMLYQKKEQVVDKLPFRSPAWLERRALDRDFENNNRLPRRFRRRINQELAFS